MTVEIAGNFKYGVKSADIERFYAPLEELAKFLEPLGFMRIDLPGDEITFSLRRVYEGLPTIVRIYSGLLKSTLMPTKGQRAFQADAGSPEQASIRVCLGRYCEVRRYVRIFKTLRMVARTPEWRQHLAERLTSLDETDVSVSLQLTEKDLLEGRTAPALKAKPEKCPVCGAVMVGPKRNGRGHLFYGCSRFPTCRGAVDAQ